jgi:UrcA family protein
VSGKTRIVLRSIAVCSFSAAAALYAAIAPADSRLDRTTVQVADLNLDHPADVAVLYERINLAAEQVCHQRALNGSYVLSPTYNRCVSDTVEKVVASVNRAPLTSFSRQRNQMRVASAGPL